MVGGGLAGCEASWQLAQQGIGVDLYEMRFTGGPEPSPRTTPAHATGLLSELVCSNSLKSVDPSNAHGLLKAELKTLGSLIIPAAEACAVPAGKALAVDRLMFAQEVTRRILAHPKIRVVSEEYQQIPTSPAIIATGPLTSEGMSQALADLLGGQGLYFYDAIAPIVSAESLDLARMHQASRYQEGEGDYLNIFLDRDGYYKFIEALLSARRHRPHGFEEGCYFEGCLPLEVIAQRGRDSLRFGLMKPVGLRDPSTGRRPFAAVQLRKEDRDGTMFNLVGFQTQLAQDEQRRVFRMLPGLEKADFLRYGSLHRNTFIDSPRHLKESFESKARTGLFLAGQLCGVEGYVESAAAGLIAGLCCALWLAERKPSIPPQETMSGALARYVARGPAAGPFQPMNANLGLLPPLEQRIVDKRKKGQALAARSLEALKRWMADLSI